MHLFDRIGHFALVVALNRARGLHAEGSDPTKEVVAAAHCVQTVRTLTLHLEIEATYRLVVCTLNLPNTW